MNTPASTHTASFHRSGLFKTLIGLLALAMLASQSARAATFYWDTNGSTAGSGAATGTWSSAGSTAWSTDSTGATAVGTVTTATTDDLFIAAGTNGTTGTITVSGAVLTNSITFDDPVAVTISGGTSITLGGGGGTGTGIFQTANGANVTNTSVILGASSTAFAFSNSSTSLLTIGAVTGAATSGTQTITVGSTSSGGITLNGIIGNGAAGGNVGITVNNTSTGVTTLSTANTYSGGTTISAGTLQITNAAGFGTNTVAIGASGTGMINVTGATTVANAFSGAGILNTTLPTGANALTLSGALSGFTGTLNVGIGSGAGKLAFSNATQGNVISSSATINVAANGTLYVFNPLNYGSSLFLNGGTTGEALGQLRIEGGATWSGNITLNANTTIGGNSAGTISGVIAGSGFGFTRLGSGTTTLTNANTYTGTTTISAGTLQLGNGTTDGSIANASNVTNNATLNFNNINPLTYTGNITGTGVLTKTGTGTLTLGGTSSIKTLNVNNATGTVDLGSGGSLTINNGGGNTIQSSTGGTITGGTITLGATDGDSGTASGTTLTINSKITSGAGVRLEYWNGAAGNTGTLVLTNAANDYTGGTVINTAGTISVSTINNTGTAGNLGTGGTISLATNAATLKYTGAGETTDRTITMSGGANTGGTIDASGTGTALRLSNVTNTNTANGTATLTLTGTGLGEITGSLVNQNGSRLIAIAKAGTGTWTLSGANTYTGATSVNSGTLVLGGGGNLGATAVTVSNAGSTFAIKQTASATSNALTGLLSLGAGTAFTMVDGFTSTFNVTGASTLAPASGASTTLSFEIGSASGSSDLLAITGAATVGTGGALLNIAPIAAPSSSANTYTLITAASGLNTNFTLGGVTNYNIGGTLFHLTLATSTATAEIASFAAGATSVYSAYWTGSQDGSWKTLTGGTTSNFTGDAAGAFNTYVLPDSNTNVTFTANGATNLSTTLDQAFTINSLTFSGTGTSNTAGTTIAAGTGGAASTLTINAAALNGNAVGNGISVAAGSGANAIGANVVLGASQTWTNNSTNALTVSGNISGSGFGITKSGTGTIVLSGTNSYSGATTVSAGTLDYSGSLSAAGQINVGVAGGGNAVMNVQAGASIAMSGNNSILVGAGTTSTTGQGFLYQTGGSITQGTYNNLQLGAGAGGTSYGYYNLSGGTASFSEVDIGSFNGTSTGVLDMSGGTMTVGVGSSNGWLIANRTYGSGGIGILNLTGGALTFSGPAGQFQNNWGSNGTAIINVGNATLTATNANINLNQSNNATNFGEINLLSGGTLQANSIASNANGTKLVNFNGGTLKASTATTTFITTNNTGVNVFNNGGTIDNNGVAITIPVGLLAPTGNGVSSVAISSGGTGYLGAPAVTFSGGGGTGAAGYATVSGGVITGIVITNPGTGYTSAPTVTLTGGGSTNATLGTVSTVANTSGGMTFQGSGTTTLSGASTYSGATTVSGGRLDLTGSLMDTAITVSGSAVFTESSAGVIGGASSVTHNSSATTTALAGTNTYAGATLVSAGTLTLSGAGSINSSSGITINGSGAKFVQTSSVAGTSAVTLTQGTLDGTGTVGSVIVGNGTGGIVTNGNGTTATLTLGSVILNGAATLIFRKVDDTSTAALAITGALATTPANGLVTLNVLTPPVWNNGSTYNLISYGSFGGANTDFTLGTLTGLGARQSATIGNTGSSSGFITLAIAGDTPVWTGLVSGAWTTTAIGGAQNWKLQTAGTGTEFLTNDQALFDDTAVGTTTVTINDATVSPASTVFNNSTKDYTLTGSNGITSGTLAKLGTGTVTISTANTYAGETSINGGTLIAGNGAALGSVAGGTTVGSGATLDINSQNLSTEVLTISGSGVGGNGALVNNGASDQIDATGRIVLAADATIGGTRRWDLRNSTPTLNMGGFTLTKTGANLVSLVGVSVSNAGHIVVNQGRLNIESTTNLGGSSANTITVNSGATLGFWAATNAVTWSVALNDATIFQDTGGSTISGPVALTGANTVNVNANTSLLISGGISGTGSLTKTGGGVLTLSHTNSYAGGTVVSAGRLAYDAGGTGGPTGNITPFGTDSVTVNSGAQLRLGTNVGGHNNSVFNIANAVTLDGGTIFAEDGIQHLTGPVNVTAASTLGSTFNGGGFDINKGLFLDGVVSGSADLTLQQSGINTGANYNTSIVYFANNSNTYSGTITVTPMGAGNGGGSYVGINATSALANATVNLGGNNTSNAQQFGTSPIVFNTGLGTATIGALSGSGNVVLTGYNQSTHAYGADSIDLDVGGNGADTSYSGVISGGGSLTKSGTGTMTLSNTSTYTGSTTVSAGTLLANNTTGSATGSGNVTAQSGARLGGSGLVGLVTGTQNITVNSGGILGIGNTGDVVGDDLDLKTSGVGVITLNGTLEFDIYDNLGSTANLTNPLDTNDLLNLTSDTSIVLSGTLKVSDLTGLSTISWVEGDTWKLLDWSNVTAGPKFSGGFTTLDLPDLAAGLDWLASTDGNGFYIAVIVVPESSRAVLMLAGLMALVLRRRRSLAAGFGQSHATMATTHSGEC